MGRSSNADIDGFMSSDIEAVNDTLLVPIYFSPEYVSTIIEPLPLLAEGMSLASSFGIVHTQLSFTFVAIVMFLDPHAYRTVCVNEDDARFM